MIEGRAVEFFDAQFRRQASRGERELNPFERAALPHLSGRILDLGCGLGNLALAAAARGCEPGGIMAVNVLVEGTTYLDMFDPAGHCLWKPADLDAVFAGWDVLHAATEEFPAPGGTLKRFRTLIVRKSTTGAHLR